VLANEWLKWNKINAANIWATERSSSTGYNQSKDSPVPETGIQAFDITVKPPL